MRVSALHGLVRQTPLVMIPAVRLRIGAVSLKLENLQRTGSFKLRGAVHKLGILSPKERARGVVAASAGNHGAGVALAATRLGIEATVVVPSGTPEIKRRQIEELGANVVVEGDSYDHAEMLAKVRASAAGAVFVSPFDDDHVITGNGRGLAYELLRQAPDLSRVVCPVGGGGLISGLASTLAPKGISVIGVEPEVNCAMHDSRAQGKALIQYRGGHTLAEGLEGAVSERTYALVRDHVEDLALVSEAAIRRAVAFCYRAAGTIVESSAAVAMAGFLEQKVTAAPKGTTVCVLTGANIEPELLDEILAESSAG